MAHNCILGGSEDQVDFPPNDYIYRGIDVAFVVFGIVTLLMDWVFDIATAYNHWCHDDFAWFILTVLFMSTSSLVIMGVSLRWYIKDMANDKMPPASKCKWVARLLLLLLQLGPLIRYYDTLYFGLKSRWYWKQGDVQRQKQYYTWMLYEDGDSVFLRMFECFMEAAPQLVLQLYILTQIPAAEDPSEYGKIWRYTISFGSFTSLVSLAWGVMAFARASRFTQMDKNNISLLGSFVIFLWHAFLLAARVTALVLFASCFRMVVMWVCLAHWVLMAGCLLVCRTFRVACSSFFSEPYDPAVAAPKTINSIQFFSEVVMSFVFGAVYIFVFLNYKDEPTRWKYLAYYTVWETENLALVVMFLLYTNPTTWYYVPGVIIHILCFALGLIFMGIYYSQLHPAKCALPVLPLPQEQETLTHHSPTHHSPTHHSPTHHSPTHHTPTHHTPTHHSPTHHTPTHHTPTHHSPTHHTHQPNQTEL